MERPPHLFEPSEFLVGGCAVCGDRPEDDPLHVVPASTIFGIDPDLTGDEPSVEYLARLLD